jgi:putative Ca2+/H+ antiporter (TMEM165/GDT1 family)
LAVIVDGEPVLAYPGETVATVLLAAGRHRSTAPLLGLVCALGAAGFPCVRRFRALAQRRDAERIERMSGLFTLMTHVGLGLTMWVNR